jgi:hypothetical protein
MRKARATSYLEQLIVRIFSCIFEVVFVFYENQQEANVNLSQEPIFVRGHRPFFFIANKITVRMCHRSVSVHYSRENFL